MQVDLNTDDGMRDAIQFMTDHKIKAIKAIPTLTGLGLKESKDAVDAFLREVPRAWIVDFRVYQPHSNWTYVELREHVVARDQHDAERIIRKKFEPHDVKIENGYGNFR